MNYISDVMYFSDLSDRPKDILDIIKNFQPLTNPNGQGDFLDGSIVEFIIPGPGKPEPPKQIVYNPNGGLYGAGNLIMQKYDMTFPTSGKFLLEWVGQYNGYYLWPMNGDKTIQLFMEFDHGTINGSYNGQNLKGGVELTDRVYKITNLNVNGGDGYLGINLSVFSTKNNNNFTIGIDKDGTVKGGSGLTPANIWVKFITLGTKAWQLLIQNNVGVSSRCCFPNADISGYTNLNTACNNSGYTPGSANCNGVIPKACSSFIDKGYEDEQCQSWCTSNPKECYNSIKSWCNDPNKKNLSKPICSCFDDGKFDLYKKDFTKNCKAPCKISDFRAGCFYPPCLQSGMYKVANQGDECPPNTNIYQSCINKALAQSGGQISAENIILQCNLNAGEADTSDPNVIDGGGNGGGNGGGTGTGTIAPPPLDQPPPAQDNSISSFWDKYKIYIIVGIVVLVLLIIVAIFVAMK